MRLPNPIKHANAFADSDPYSHKCAESDEDCKYHENSDECAFCYADGKQYAYRDTSADGHSDGYGDEDGNIHEERDAIDYADNAYSDVLYTNRIVCR